MSGEELLVHGCDLGTEYRAQHRLGQIKYGGQLHLFEEEAGIGKFVRQSLV